MMILQLGTTVVTSAAVSSVPTTVTVTKSKTAFTAGQSMNFHEPHPGTNQISQQAQSQIIHRPADHTVKTTVRYKPEPSCIVEVHTPKLPSRKVEEVSSEEVVPKEEIIDTRPSSSGEVIAQFVLQDHNYVAALPASPPLSPTHTKASSVVNGLGLGNNSLTQGSAPYAFGSGLLALRNAPRSNDDDDTNSVISSNPGREVEPEGEETETAPEGEGEEDAITRCICDFEHDDGYMVICDKCMVWQHVQCMFVDQANFPKESEEYLCERCQPRRVDRVRARLLQLRKREELHNDSSSDATSTDTDSGIGKLPQVGVAARKRRRKSETVNPVKKNSSISSNNSNSGSSHSNTNSNNSSNTSNNPVTSNAPQAKPLRQRRDSVTSVMQRRSSVQSRKKEAQSLRQADTKRVPVRRKSKNRVSDDDNKEANVLNPVQQLRQWIDNYEEAVTNHYSPELRARISNIRVNGVHSDLKVSNLHGSNSGSKCRVMQSSPGVRILVANMMLSANVPVIELRGKYMLSSQQKSSPLPIPSTKRSRPPPGPFLFFYRLPKDGPEVCVDTRTYGNDARFIRRSCKPNAEVRHCIEKGILHLYIVTTSSVEKNNEITISHDGSLDPVGQRFVCACGNPKECCGSATRNGLHESSERERRRRGRRAHSSEDDTSQQVNTSPPSQLVSSPSTSLPSSAMSRRNSNSNRSPVKTPSTPPPSTDDSCEKAVECSPVKVEKAEKKKKLTREERKMEAIMKAFERLEKDEQKQKEHMAKQQAMRTGKDSTMEVKKESPPIDEPEDTKHTAPVASRCLPERPKRRRRKGRGRLNSTTQPAQQTLRQHRRRTRQNSGDSDVSSADEILKAEPVDPPSSPDAAVVSSNDVNSQDSTTGNKMQTAADLLLALSNTQIPDEEQSFQPSPDAELPSPVAVNTPQGHSGGVNANLFNSTVCDSGGSSSQSSTPPTPLSSACLLVAAAVGPLAPGFKFPKTKKVLMNEWLNKSPDLPSNSTPSTILPPSSGSTEGLEAFTSYDKSLATLVQAASRVGMNGSSSTQRSGSDPGVGSAKKRWLRQAISEECDSPTAVCTSPNSRPESPPYVAPLKKRRLARESMSSEQSFTPPTTPTEHLMSHGSPQPQKCGSHCSVANNIAAACEDGEPVGSPEGLGSPNTQEDEDDEDEDEEEDYEDGDEQNSNVLRDSVKDETYKNNHRINSNDNVCLQDFKKVEDKEGECVEEGKELNTSQSIIHPPETEEDEDEEDVEEEELEEEEDEEGEEEEEKMQVRQFNSDKLEKEDQSSNPATAQPTKRKLSISEYRQRKQRNNSCSEQLPRIEENENSSPAPCGRSRSDSTSSSTSSESSDDVRTNKILETPSSLSTLPLFLHSDGSEDKKAGEEMNYMRWNSAPTLVERQRENLTERLRREFGLFLSDDEEQERVRKQGLAPEGSKDGKKKAPPPPPPPPSVPPPDAGTRLPLMNMYSHPYGTANAAGSYGPVYVPGTGARPQNSSSSSYIYSCPLKGGAPVYSSYPVTGGSKGLGNSPKPYLLPSPYPQGHPQQVVMVGPPRTGTYGSQPSSSAAAPQQNSVNNASFYTVAAAKYYQSAPRS